MLPQFVQPKRTVAYTMALLQNREHGAGAFDLGNDAVVCVVDPSSTVVAAGHGCGRDGVKPSSRRSFWPGLVVDGVYPKRSWLRSMHHGTVLGDGGASASVEPAGQTSGKARCAASNTGGQWQLDALPGLLPPFVELLEREKTKTARVVECSLRQTSRRRKTHLARRWA